MIWKRIHSITEKSLVYCKSSGGTGDTPVQRWPVSFFSVFRLVVTYDIQLIWWAVGWNSLYPSGWRALRTGGLKCAIVRREWSIKRSACKHWFTARRVDTNCPWSLTDSQWFLVPFETVTVSDNRGKWKGLRGLTFTGFECSLQQRFRQM